MMMRLGFVRGRRDNAPAIIRAHQSDGAHLKDWREPRHVRITIYALASMLAIALVLSFVLLLDRVVTSSAGQIVSVEPNIVLQAFDDSIIRALNVKEGDEVTEGQVLATLDPTFTTADLNQLRNQHASAHMQIVRLEAERAGTPMPDPTIEGPAVEYLALQKALFRQRKAQFEAQLHSFDQKIAQTEATIIKVRADAEQLAQRLAIFEEIEGMRVTLEAKAITSKLQLLQARDQRIETNRNLELARNSLIESQYQLAGLKSDREAFSRQWFSTIEQELITAKQVRDTTEESLSKAQRKKDLVTLTAPERGVVLKLAKLSVGSVLKGGEIFLQMVPTKSPLEAEVRIGTDDVAYIRSGDFSVIKLDAFDYIERGWVEGKVKWISEGAFTLDDDSRPVAPYYRVRIAVTANKLRNLPESTRLMPGMRLSADIHVGRRSVFAYLFHRAIRVYGEAMRER